MSASPHILVVEDDLEINRLVTRYLRANDCRVSATVPRRRGRMAGTLYQSPRRRCGAIVFDRERERGRIRRQPHNHPAAVPNSVVVWTRARASGWGSLLRAP
jgi:hypothetical protein